MNRPHIMQFFNSLRHNHASRHESYIVDIDRYDITDKHLRDSLETASDAVSEAARGIVTRGCLVKIRKNGVDEKPCFEQH